MSDVTRILERIEQGDPQAAEKLLPLVYDELRKLAAAKLAQEKPGQTLQATALVHEAYLRLMGQKCEAPAREGDARAREGEAPAKPRLWNSRGHFFGAAAEAMRRVLVEQARAKKSSKRGGDRQRRDLVEMTVCPNPRIDDLLDLDDALQKLAKVDPAAAKLLELRVFAGMSVEDAAQLLGVSPRTSKRTWAYARAWLRREAGLDDGSNL
jgi:RNA polymerase sigma factor (sigma-70 family)